MVILITPSEQKQSDGFMVGDIHVSPQHNTLTKKDKTSRVQPKAMAVLTYLANHSDRVINNDELLDQVWQGRVVTHSSIQKSVNALRSAFKALDSDVDYIVYFSKRGYQLVIPEYTISSISKASASEESTLIKPISTTLIATLIITVIIAYLAYAYIAPVNSSASKSTQQGPSSTKATQSVHSTNKAHTKNTMSFRQVKPFVSNTGTEKIIAPHHNSKRVAFIRDEIDEKSTTANTQSQLYIQGTNGQQWQVSLARGNFVNLAWSPSGRNLVAIDAHYDMSDENPNKAEAPAPYYSFHIYTLDYKAEKVIEKNQLSYWSGHVSSVAWWDEGTLEFTASQGTDYALQRYRYDIAEQNISTLKKLPGEDKLLSAHIFNKKTALLSLNGDGEKIYFLNSSQQVTGNWSIPFKVISMNWLSNEQGVLLLSADNNLSILYTDGSMHSIDYSPKVKGQMMHARSKNKGRSIVVTVDALSTDNEALYSSLQNSSEAVAGVGFSQERFLEKGGGFIYSTTSMD